MNRDDQNFLEAFESCTLAPEAWTHAAHIRMAWLYLGTADFETALERIRAGILRYNAEILDKLSEYHETVTVAFARIIAARLRPGERWDEFAQRNEDLFARTPPALSSYYSSGLLMSSRARRTFVEPDLRPLPQPV